jgi:hypothetical protein
VEVSVFNSFTAKKIIPAECIIDTIFLTPINLPRALFSYLHVKRHNREENKP